MALNAIPTTTRPDVIIANSAFDRSLIAFKPIPTTTKPIVTITDQNVIKNLKVSSAVTTTTIPNYILANTQQFDLTHKTQTLLASLEANLLGLLDLVTAKKKDVVDENLQVLTIGDEEKNINGALIIVVLEDGEYELGLPNYIARKEQEGYQVKIEKVSNIGKKPEQMKDYFKKMKLADPNFKFAVIPLNYLSGMVVYNGSRIAISDYYYCKLFDNSSTTLTGLFSPEIYISRANRAMLEKEYIKLTENKMLITFPIMRFLHKIYDEGC